MKKFMTLLMITCCVWFTLSTYAQEAWWDAELEKLLNELQWSSTTQPANWTTQGAEEQVVPEKTAEEQHNAADEILDAADGAEWALSAVAKTEVKDVTATGAVIATTQVTYKGTPVTKYKILYADKPLANLDNLKNVSNVIVDVDSTEWSMVMLKFENLTPNKLYYVSVIPVNPDDANKEPSSMISEEVMFTTKEKVVVAAPEAQITKVFENVSYTHKDNSVELTWTPTAAVEKAQIEMRHQSESTYTKIGTPMMKDGKFVFSVWKPGTYFIKLNGLDASGNMVWQEHVQTVKVDEVIKLADPVQAAPKVWPATDLMIALMVFASIVYGVVRFRKIQH
jgi:hypothetical protein